MGAGEFDLLARIDLAHPDRVFDITRRASDDVSIAGHTHVSEHNAIRSPLK
jgi:hypothetical protein